MPLAGRLPWARTLLVATTAGGVLAGDRKGRTVQPIGLAIDPRTELRSQSGLGHDPRGRGEVSGVGPLRSISVGSSARLVQFPPIADGTLVRLHD